MAEPTDARNQLDTFVVPFEEQTLSYEAAVQAGVIFREGMENLFLQNMEVSIQADHKDGGPLHADVRLLIEGRDSSKLRIIVRKNNPEHTDDEVVGRPLYRIHITEERPDRSDGTIIFYSFHESSSLVTRRDVSEDWEQELKLRRQLEPMPDFTGMSRAETAAYFDKAAARSQERVANLNLEVEMGINDQPVGVEEVEALLELLQSAIPLSEADWELMQITKYDGFDGENWDSSQETDDNANRVSRIRKAASTLLNLIRKR